MDIQKLITTGKIERTVTVTGVGDIQLATPPGDVLKEDKPYHNIAQFIVKLGDKDCSTPEKKEEVAKVLSQLQVAVFGKLVAICGEMTKEQTDFVDELFSKKS